MHPSLFAIVFSYICVAPLVHAFNEKTPLTAELEQIKTAMNAPLWTPSDLSDLNISCRNAHFSTTGHAIKSKPDFYTSNHWEKALQIEKTFFDISSRLGRILVIDTDTTHQLPRYRYLSNGTETEHYEPWSTSKVFAFTGAMATLRQAHGVGATGSIGQYNIADLISSIHSYAPHGTADGDSNAIASYFVNMATRDRLTALFQKAWLNLSDAHTQFRGAYANKLIQPASHTWRPLQNGDANKSPIAITVLEDNKADPGYLEYRCANCGVTGNKPMTTLAMAEWLKRLAMHELDPATSHPHLTLEDVDVLFHGTGHSDANKPTAGMMAGIGHQLGMAVAAAITGRAVSTSDKAIDVLNRKTNGKWRIYQKIGWGTSETRGTGENVMLANVCLPLQKKTISFTLAAQAAHPEATEASVYQSGKQMQTMLNMAMKKLLTGNQIK